MLCGIYTLMLTFGVQFCCCSLSWIESSCASLSLFLVTPPQFFPPHQIPAADLWVVALIRLELSAATLQLSAAMKQSEIFPKDFKAQQRNNCRAKHHIVVQIQCVRLGLYSQRRDCYQTYYKGRSRRERTDRQLELQQTKSIKRIQSSHRSD